MNDPISKLQTAIADQNEVLDDLTRLLRELIEVWS